MFLYINCRVLDETGMRHILEVGPPGAAASFDLISQIICVDEAIFAVRSDPKSIAAKNG